MSSMYGAFYLLDCRHSRQTFSDITCLLQESRKAAKDAVDKYYALKQERVTRFMEGFTHISEKIDKIYKELTKLPNSMGGTAYLSLENKEEPFNGGIKCVLSFPVPCCSALAQFRLFHVLTTLSIARYNAMPPLKRFRDMDQLSGGEQTVAALALLFAIHSYQHAPFFILDEVDAALDPRNVGRVANYIRSRTQEDMQCLVISLKESFFERADALIGVYRDQVRGPSHLVASLPWLIA